MRAEVDKGGGGCVQELIGAVGGMLHTGRSRNDQVATDVRLWMRGALEVIRGQLRGLIEVFAHRALVSVFTAYSL